MIIPCIDLMDGKVVQLVQGREKVLEGKSRDEMLASLPAFRRFRSSIWMRRWARARTATWSNTWPRRAYHSRRRRRPKRRARAATYRTRRLPRHRRHCGIQRNRSRYCVSCKRLADAVGPDELTLALDSKDGHIVVKGWQEATHWTAVEMIAQLEPYCSGFLCTYVDKEGMMQGTDLDWFKSLRSATKHEIIAAGGITTMDDIAGPDRNEHPLRDRNVDLHWPAST